MALQNHNLLIALGAARQAGATGAQHFAMPVRITNIFRKLKNTWIVIDYLHETNFCALFNFSLIDRHISLIRISYERNNLAMPAVMRTVMRTAILR